MTGIERLRRVAEAQDMRNAWTAMLSHELSDIADQIESEHKNDLVQYHVPWSKVQDVMLDMERHVSGVEGAEDSPVARWARELRYALKSDTSDGRGEQNPSWHDPADAADVTSDAPKVTRDPAEDVSMSAYDLLPADEREAIAWVREHGGLDEVRKLARHETKEEVELVALGKLRCLAGVQEGDAASIADMGESIARRLMPEGMEWLLEAWPRFEDDTPMRIGDEISWKDGGGKVNSIELQDGGYFILHAADGAEDWILPQYFPGERVKRPAPKVLDADGVEIRVGDTVYHVKDGSEMTVYGIEGEWLVVSVGGRVRHDIVTHRAPVLAADGKPLEVGQTVWHVGNGVEFTVVGLPRPGEYQAVKLRLDDGAVTGLDPDQLTHQRPVLDANGVPIKVGDTVWRTEDGREFEVAGIYGVDAIRVKDESMGHGFWTTPFGFTHAKPEPPDSWERIEEDAKLWPGEYAQGHPGWAEHDGRLSEFMALDLVRRAKALAGRSE